MSFDIGNFQWEPGTTVNLTADVASTRVLFRTTTLPYPTAALFLRIIHFGAALVWVEQGGSTVVAAVATSVPVAPGQAFYCRVTKGGWIAGIAAAATPLYVTPGYL